MASAYAIREEITKEEVRKLEELFEKAGIEYYRTAANFNTITYECGEAENGEPLYGSIKFTLHKANYNLDDEIEEYELFREDRERKKKLAEEKAAQALKDREMRRAKAEARKVLEEKKRADKRASLGLNKEEEVEE